MANDSTSFFYWYRRYKVRAVDMAAFQEAMAETARGLGEGSFGAAVLRGFTVQPATGFHLNIGAGIATAASGYLEVMNGAIVLDATPASGGTLPCRSLVVATPNPTDANFINSPTSPFTQVPLNQLQRATVTVIPGTPSVNPDYPAKGPNDVILAGLIVPAGVGTLTQAMIDYEVRESIGLNSIIGQNQVRFDNRLRPYRSGPQVLGIKPSQNVGSAPLGFSYPGRLTPSLYPLTAGAFTPQDSFVNFQTGAISGGDTTTPMFSVDIPASGNSVVCVVTLTQQDTLNFNFGTQGGYAACLGAIQNQIFSGPGGLPAPDGNFGIAFAILSSLDGVHISDTQVFDGRPFLGSGAAAAKFQAEFPTGAINGVNATFTLSKTPMDPNSLDFWVGGSLLEKTQYTLSGPTVTITNAAFIPSVGQDVYAKYLIFGAVSNTPATGIPTAKFKQEVPGGAVNGVNTVFSLSSVPVDPQSLDFWVGSNNLELTDYTLSGSTVTITNPAFIPQVGQQVYAKYLYLGVISGGGGGGGASGYQNFGSRASPIVIGAAGMTPSSDPLQEWFIKSAGGAVAVTGNPQIAAGSMLAQHMTIKIVDGVNFPYFQDGNGLDLNGPWPNPLAPSGVIQGSTINLSWDGQFWSEDSRR